MGTAQIVATLLSAGYASRTDTSTRKADPALQAQPTAFDAAATLPMIPVTAEWAAEVVENIKHWHENNATAAEMKMLAHERHRPVVLKSWGPVAIDDQRFPDAKAYVLGVTESGVGIAQSRQLGRHLLEPLRPLTAEDVLRLRITEFDVQRGALEVSCSSQSERFWYTVRNALFGG